MEEILKFLLGAAIGLKAVKAASGELRPALQGAARGGALAAGAVRSAASQVSQGMAEIVAEARQEMEASRAKAPKPAPPGPRKIEVIKE